MSTSSSLSNPNMAAEVRQSILEEAWLNEAFNVEWTDGSIVKIPKKGNLTICDNWLGISAISKITFILDRINDQLYSNIDRKQAGLTAGSSCVDHMNMLRIIIEQGDAYLKAMSHQFCCMVQALGKSPK